MTRIITAVIAASLAALLAGCPDNPYSYETHVKKLDDPHEFERAVTDLQNLCDPRAIPALGRAWEKNNQPTRVLQVIIDLARPLTAGPGGQADQQHCTDFVAKGRPASWDAALPILRKAIEDLDTNSQRSIDNAVKAAEAIGDAQLTDGVQVLIDVVNTKMKPKDNGQRVRLTAIMSLGKFKDKGAINTLANVIRADPSSQPPHVVGAAINALGEMKSPDALPVLIEAMYRSPLFFQQIRRALVASGGDVKAEMRKILRHEHGDVNALFKEKKLDKYCGDDGKAPPSDCQEVSAMDYYAAIVVGDLYDKEAVPVLLEALKRPAKPAYFSDWNAGPPAHNAILDALRKIGDPSAADAVLALWADPKADERLRPVAATVYGFVSVDGSEKVGGKSGVTLLGEIAGNNDADQALRLAASESFGRLARSKSQAVELQKLAKKYAEASAKARKEAEGEPKKAYDAASKEFEAAKVKYDEAKKAVDKAKAEAGGDVAKVDPAVLNAATEAKAAFDKVKKEKYNPAREKYEVLDGQAKGYKGYQRGFENHVARVEVAARCGDKIDCLMGTFDAKPQEVFERLKKDGYLEVSDDKEWTDQDKIDLKTAQIERAVLEIRKLGSKAADQVGPLLDRAQSKEYVEDRLVRQSILLALPRIAPLPCKDCVEKLQKAIDAGQGKQELNELNYETQLVTLFFSWAGGNVAEKQ